MGIYLFKRQRVPVKKQPKMYYSCGVLSGEIGVFLLISDFDLGILKEDRGHRKLQNRLAARNKHI